MEPAVESRSFLSFQVHQEHGRWRDDVGPSTGKLGVDVRAGAGPGSASPVLLRPPGATGTFFSSLRLGCPVSSVAAQPEGAGSPGIFLQHLFPGLQRACRTTLSPGSREREQGQTCLWKNTWPAAGSCRLLREVGARLSACAALQHTGCRASPALEDSGPPPTPHQIPSLLFTTGDSATKSRLDVSLTEALGRENSSQEGQALVVPKHTFQEGQ